MRNLVIASNIYGASAFLSVGAYFLSDPKPGVFGELAVLVLTLLIAYLIRQGYKWTRWFLVGLWIVFVPLYIYGLIHLKKSAVAQIPTIVVSMLQLVSLIYLFLPNKINEQQKA